MNLRSRPTRLLGGTLLVLALGLAAVACGGDPASPEAAGSTSRKETPAVRIALFRYQPETLEVPAGTTVTWRNEDAILHTVTSGDPGRASGRFDEELADKGTTASVTFDTPGTFTYFCARHPEAMRGQVVVSA